MFDLVVKDRGTLVDMLQALGLVGNHIARDAVGQNELDGSVDALGMSPRQRVDGFELLLVLLADLGMGPGGFILVVALDRLDLGTDEGGLLALGGGADGVGLVLFILVEIAFVVVGDNASVGVAGEVKRVVVLPKKRTHRDVPEAQAAVFFDKTGSLASYLILVMLTFASSTGQKRRR